MTSVLFLVSILATTGTGGCGCTDSPEPYAEFLEPMDGATVPETFMVSVAARDVCFCNFCQGVYAPMSMWIEVDGEPYGDPCDMATCDFAVTASPGPHEIGVRVRYCDREELFSPVTIQVTVEATGGTDTDGAAAGGDDGKGCACAAGAGAPASVLPFAGLLLWGRRRRRGR